MDYIELSTATSHSYEQDLTYVKTRWSVKGGESKPCPQLFKIIFFQVASLINKHFGETNGN